MKSALAIFAKTPLPGSVKTRLTPPLSAEQGAELYRCMLLDIVSRVATLPMDTVVFYDGDRSFFEGACPGTTLLPQLQAPLGERLTAAFATLEDSGYEASLVIGSDSPDLPLNYLMEALAHLEGGADAVFGPAEDGGYYLVALCGTREELFRGIPWSTGEVLATTLKRARSRRLKTELLPPWYDVDDSDDLLRPGLMDPQNGAPLTRAFLAALGLAGGHHPLSSRKLVAAR